MILGVVEKIIKGKVYVGGKNRLVEAILLNLGVIGGYHKYRENNFNGRSSITERPNNI